jgi:putative oxidoreductase
MMSKGKTIALWIVSILIAALFLFAGLSKLLALDKAKQMFAQVGYAGWFATFIGVCETLGGIGVLIPRLAGLAAAGLSIIMIGAVYTVVSHHQSSQAVVPLVTLIVLIWVGYTRFKNAQG